ncbi:MAG: DUF3472 domain-containing protein [Verrucomicrobiaceae bacterium]|nr:DUF3472 domain-containing protein [Verrucomicrobiaceae bacterium]
MTRIVPLFFFSLVGLCAPLMAELRVPAFTAYTDPNPDAMRVSKDNGISGWSDKAQHVLWFGELKAAGAFTASVAVKAKDGVKLKLAVNSESHDAAVNNGVANFGSFTIAKAGYTKFELSRASDEVEAVDALVLDGEAVADAHFNLEPRRNAASVHLAYPTPKDAEVAMFYNEVTAVKDPVYTFYMVCGFSRGYFGMQVNSDTERRIIFSVWDSGAGQGAKDRSAVATDDQTQLLGKGEGVEASVFGNEGTGGHSHLLYPWKTGEAQKFVVTAKADGTHTIYSGYWFHSEKQSWMLIASFRAPKDGKLLRGLHSFSENFGGSNGHLQRKALYGPQWTADTKGQWSELLEAKFSHDPTGKSARLDRFMGVENGKFFLSHGGFVEGFTKYGQPFTRRASEVAPHFEQP